MKNLLSLSILVTLTFPFSTHAASSYMQNFNGYANDTTDLSDGTVIASDSGSASIQNNALRLSFYEQSGEIGNFRIPGLSGSAAGWTASFTVSLSSPDAPADGFSFSWGSGIPLLIPVNDPDEISVGGSEEGWGVEVDHLYFSFDPLDNGDNEWGLAIGGADGLNTYTFANMPGQLAGAEQNINAEVFISWDPIHGASFRTTGFNTNIDVSNILTPGITAADSNVFAFASRTGALTQTLLIDNLNIQSVPEPSAVLLSGLGGLLLMRRRRPI
ncbi:MAG: PEP-CTERM sorting domain-containing protein [Akkermansiaceae bacterium]|nr:PEP-CTERM sorting domain-containing protein [Akkermansiaceae bacterium]